MLVSIVFILVVALVWALVSLLSTAVKKLLLAVILGAALFVGFFLLGWAGHDAMAEDFTETDGIIVAVNYTTGECVAVCDDGTYIAWFDDDPQLGQQVHLLLFGRDSEVIDVVYYSDLGKIIQPQQ